MKNIKTIIFAIILLLPITVWSFPPTPPTGDVAADAIWDAAGDLAVGTGRHTAGRLAIGSVGKILKSDGTTAAWTASPSVATLTARSANSITLGTDSAGSGPAIGSMIFHNATNTNHFSLISGTTGAALSWTLPIAAPGGNDYLLNASTAGVLGYTNPATFSIAAGSSSIVTVGALSAGSLTTGFTPVTVPLGGTGASTYALNGVLYGNAANAIGVTAIGTAGQILKVGADPFVPVWTSSLTGITLGGLTASRAVYGDASGNLVSHATLTDTELGYVDGVTSAIQGQIDLKAPLISPSFTTPVLGQATATQILATGIVDGTAPVVITATSSNYQLGATYKSGYTFINPTSSSASNSVILPAVAAGLQYVVGNYAGKTGTLTVTTKTGVGVQYIDLDGVLTANTGHIQATAVAGNIACFVGLSDSVWKAIPTKGTWSKD